MNKRWGRIEFRVSSHKLRSTNHISQTPHFLFQLLTRVFVPLCLFFFITPSYLCASVTSSLEVQPKHSRVVELEDGRIRLWWDLSISNDIQSYRIYEQTNQDEWKLVATVPAYKQWWQSISKTNSQFSVSAVNKYGIEGKSRKPAITIPFLRISTDNCMTSFIDDQNNIWIGTPGGVKKINIDTNQVKVYTVKDGLINNYVQAIIQDRQGYLWFGTREGLSCYTGKLWKTYTKDDGLLSDNILSIMQDNYRCFWFGTSEGVSRYNGKKWTTYAKNEGMSGYAVKNIKKDNDGNIWFATTDGINKYDRKEWTIYSKDFGLASNDILTIYKDKTGRLWFGGNFGGISIYDGKEWFIYNNSEISHTPVRSIIEDMHNNFWFAAGEKVVKFDGYNWESYGVNDGLASYDILSLSVDKTGRIWAVGTCILNKGCGISQYNGEIWRPWTGGLIPPLNMWTNRRIFLYGIPILVLLFLGLAFFIGMKKILPAYSNLALVKIRNLFKKILADPDIFFTTIYEILPENKYPLSTLNHLSTMLKVKHQFAALLCQAYYHLQKAINEEKVTEVLNQGLLTRTVEALQHTTHFKWGNQICSMYNFLAKAWEAENFHQILEMEITLNQTATLLQENGFIIPEMNDMIFRLKNEFFGIIGQYQRARISKKKMECLQNAIAVLTELQSEVSGIRVHGAENRRQPEIVFLQKVLANWALKVNDYIQTSNNRAQIEYRLKNNNLLYAQDGMLVFDLTNIGGGPARNISMELLSGDGYLTVLESKKEVNLLIPQRTIGIELGIQPTQNHTIVVEVLLRFDDLEKSGKQIRISEKINVFAVSDVIKNNVYKKLSPNPYQDSINPKPNTEEDARKLITQPVANYFQYDPLAIEKILKFTAGHPYFVYSLCHEIVNYRNKTKKNYITLVDINYVVNTIIENNVLSVVVIWDELSLDSQIFLSLMNAILNSGEDSSVKGIEDFMVRYNLNLDVKTIITELLRKEIIKEKNGYYEFRIEILRLWINHYKNIQQLSGRVSKYSPLWE